VSAAPTFVSGSVSQNADCRPGLNGPKTASVGTLLGTQRCETPPKAWDTAVLSGPTQRTEQGFWDTACYQKRPVPVS
jgi:hypothetical protein